MEGLGSILTTQPSFHPPEPCSPLQQMQHPWDAQLLLLHGGKGKQLQAGRRTKFWLKSAYRVYWHSTC